MRYAATLILSLALCGPVFAAYAEQNSQPQLRIPGMGIDSNGNQIPDPTENVKALTEAAVRRLDDLRAAFKELNDTKISNLEKTVDSRILALEKVNDLRDKYQESLALQREEHQANMMRAEAERLNSIRQVDREEVAKTAVSANTAITNLAKQTTDLATTLAKQVTDTAVAAEARNATQYNDTNKRLSALELALSAGTGKQEGIGVSWGVVVAVAGIAVALWLSRGRAPVSKT